MPAAGQAIAIVDEAGMAGSHDDLGEALRETRQELPVRRRLIAVEQSGGGQQHRAVADRAHHPHPACLGHQEVEIGAGRVADEAGERGGSPPGTQIAS